jgi:DNA-binding transcriptional MerR regulator
MEYTVQALARMAGVTARALRYYEQIGLLKPGRFSASGYRLYDGEQVDRLQQILLYRELGVPLGEIARLLSAPDFDRLEALRSHREKLKARRLRIQALVEGVEKTIAMCEGRLTMSDQEKFEAFKRGMLEENEEKYGDEIRAKYTEEEVKRSNEQFARMTKEQYEKFEALREEVLCALREAFLTGDPAGLKAQEAADLHRQWLTLAWGKYNGEAHAGLVRMYAEDERFAAYYDEGQPGKAAFLRDAILIYTGRKAR